MGTAIAAAAVSGYALWLLFGGKLVIRFTREQCTGPDWAVIRSLFKFGLPTGVQGIAMNIAGVLLLRFIGGLEFSAAAQAAYTIGYTELFSMITWTSVGLMGAAATIAGQNLGAGKPERALQGVYAAARIGLLVAGVVGAMFLVIPNQLLARLRRRRRPRRRDRPPAAALPGRSRASSSAPRSPSPAACRAPATPRARSTSPWCRRSPCRSGCAPCSRACAAPAGRHLAGDPARPLHPLRAVVPALPPGQVAHHQGGAGAGAAGSRLVDALRTPAAGSTGTSASRRSPGWSGSGTSASGGGRCC